MECEYTRWGVSKRDGVLIYRTSSYIENGPLINGMGCYFTGWVVSKRNGVLVNGKGC